MSEDKELNAMAQIISLLTPLDEEERSRVLEYVLKRLHMAAIQSSSDDIRPSTESLDSSTPSRPIKDIRSLTAEKQPRSANEMVVLVAYYLSELAGPNEHLDTINADVIRRYFKMAGFPLPKVLKNVLPNALAAGYLESASRGEYRINPVGYNLVVHGLPRSGSPGPASRGTRAR